MARLAERLWTVTKRISLVMNVSPPSPRLGLCISTSALGITPTAIALVNSFPGAAGASSVRQRRKYQNRVRGSHSGLCTQLELKCIRDIRRSLLAKSMVSTSKDRHLQLHNELHRYVVRRSRPRQSPMMSVKVRRSIAATHADRDRVLSRTFWNYLLRSFALIRTGTHSQPLDPPEGAVSFDQISTTQR